MYVRGINEGRSCPRYEEMGFGAPSSGARLHKIAENPTQQAVYGRGRLVHDTACDRVVGGRVARPDLFEGSVARTPAEGWELGDVSRPLGDPVAGAGTGIPTGSHYCVGNKTVGNTNSYV